MTRALRIALTAIVLVNLAFVHATEDASLSWLAPMYAATILSPWLARFSGSAIYRWTWNFAVIGIFAVLVRHTAVAGPRYLLEDGLRLAAVCQVHVLCTLGTRQTPDLLFFNSFLIAVVTAFLTQDALYFVVFLAYAPLLVTGLCLYAARSAPAATIVKSALLRSGVAIAVTSMVFFVWPRDFQRKGMVVERLTLGPSGEALQVGFTDVVRLGQKGGASSSEAVVLRATLLSGDSADVPGYWRGATQLDFDGESWSAGPSARLGDPQWREGATRAVVRDVPGEGPVFDVELLDASAGRLFVPLPARSIAIVSPQPEETPAALFDGTLRFMSQGAGRDVDNVRFRLELGATGVAQGGATPASESPQLAPALQLQEGRVPRDVADIALEVRQNLPADAAQHAVVEAMRERLASRTDYLPPGAADAAPDLAAFVSGRAGGHCEHFASALATMLRSVRIPCRLVTGYMTDDWDAKARQLTIRRRDAHAWVEVKDPAAGWYTVDPTPATGRGAARGRTLMASIEAWARRAWDSVIRFDDESRDAVLMAIVALPARAIGFLSDRPAACALAAALVAAAAILGRLRRARRVPAEVREYRACLRRLRIAPRRGETPRDLVARAASLGLASDAVERLGAATRRHEAARYARGVPDARAAR